MNSDEECNLVSEISDVLKKQEINSRHSYFQLKYFLIGKEPTMQSKMWQCLRELKSRNESVASMNLELEELKDKIKLLDISVRKINHDMEKTAIDDKISHELLVEECEIKVRQLNRQKKSLENNIDEILDRKRCVLEESKFFLVTLKNFIQVEPLRHFDDLDSQKEYWHEKLTQKVNLKMLTQGNVDTELVETIVALPDDIKIKQQTLQTLNMKQNEILLRMADNAKKIEEKLKKET
jgi:hypothetical protein